MLGPTIILDKSALQSFNKDELRELDLYFSVVTPPVLILEILADLKKSKDIEHARATVQMLARKLQSIGRINLDYRSLCTANLLGQHIPMEGAGIIGRARPVRTRDGASGVYTDIQPESEALIRWSCGKFDSAEELLATQWRASIKAMDLEGFHREFRIDEGEGQKSSIAKICKAVDAAFVMPEVQQRLIDAVLTEISAIPELKEWTLNRWRREGNPLLRDFAPYAYHCIRTTFIFYHAVLREVIGTRLSNRIDMEYLYYTPFANVFCSGDILHFELARDLIEPQCSFVSRDELRPALSHVAEARRNRDTQARNKFVEPDSESLIRKLWIRHFGRWPDTPPGAPVSRSPEETEEIMQRIRPFMDAIKEDQAKTPRQRRWPNES